MSNPLNHLQLGLPEEGQFFSVQDEEGGRYGERAHPSPHSVRCRIEHLPCYYDSVSSVANAIAEAKAAGNTQQSTNIHEP